MFPCAGIHSGPAMSGVAGKIRRRFTVFGHTVNMASRTESTCPTGRIQVTDAARALAAPHMAALDRVIELEERGPVSVKGSEDPMMIYLVKEAVAGGQEVDGALGDWYSSHWKGEDVEVE